MCFLITLLAMTMKMRLMIFFRNPFKQKEPGEALIMPSVSNKLALSGIEVLCFYPLCILVLMSVRNPRCTIMWWGM